MRKACLAVFALALALRIVHVLQISQAPFFPLLMGDAKSYHEWALRIAGGEWIGRDVFYQAPLYPYFLGALYAVIGRSPTAIRLVQSVIGSLSCVLLLLAVRRLVSPRAGVVAGVMLALWAPAIFFDALIQKSVLDVFFVCLVLWLMTRRAWLGLGAALGALALTRENALVFVAVVGAWALAQPGRLRNAALVGAGVALVLVPVAARNYAVGGGFYLTTSQFGPNFYIGNNPHADGTYAPLRYGRGAPEFERQDATEIAESDRGRRLSPAEVSAYWSDQALTFITAQPARWLALVGRKFVLLWNATEMVDTESQETHAEWSWPLRLLGPIAHFGVLVPLALFGAMVGWRERPQVRVVLVLIAAYAASVIAFYVFARYRYPLVPLLIVPAAAGLAGGPGVLRSRRRLVPAIAAAAAVAVFANWPTIPRDWLRAVSENNIAVALQAEGRYDDAIDHYRRAVAFRGDYAPALNNMGTAQRAAGRVDAAVGTYERALALRTDYPEAQYNLGNALNEVGRGAEAIGHFQRALASMPASADVHNNLGIALASQGRVDAAIAQFREAVRTDPQSARARRNLGDTLIASGAVDEGLAEMTAAVRLAPDDGGLRYDLGSALLEAGRSADAVTELREAVARLPRSVEAHNNLGIALGSLGRLDAAADQFRAALAIAPDSADARKNLAMAVAAQRAQKPRP